MRTGGWLLLALCAGVLGAAGCTGDEPTLVPPPFGLVITVPAGLAGGAEAEWSVSWQGGTAPFSVHWNLGAGAAPAAPETTAAASPASLSVTLQNASPLLAADYSYSITLTDARGLAGTALGTYTVGPRPDQPPVISSVTIDGLTVTINAADSDGDEVLISVTPPVGFSVDPLVAGIPSGSGSRDFTFTPLDILNGGTGTAEFSAEFEAGTPSTESVAISSPPLELAAYTLYCIPLERTVRVGEPVHLLVVTGPTASPFYAMLGVGVTCPEDARRVNETFDAGLPGGEYDAVDGIWTQVGAPGLLPFIAGGGFSPEAADIGGGRERRDYSILPLGGGSPRVGASGVLFSHQLTFSVPGVKSFRFQELDVVKRTYYASVVGADDDLHEYYWSDISNAHAGVPNSVTVTE